MGDPTPDVVRVPAASNGRAEVAMKAVKKALRENTDADEKLDSDAVARALLLMRNTPDRQTSSRWKSSS